MSVGGRVDDPARAAPVGQVVWPVRCGMLPPLTEGFVARPESAPGLGQVLKPGTAVALTPARSARAAVQPGSPDWAGSVGKTQLAAYFAETLWRAREIELLLWVNAASRVSILSAYAAAAAAALGVDLAGGDGEAIAARFVSWLGETSRAWLVVLDDLSAAQDVEGLWPAGPAGRTLVTTAEPPASLGRAHLQAFPMSGLSRREALSYLLGRLTEDRGQRTGAIDLVDILAGEPLALGHASAVLDSSILSCRDYLDQYLRKREQLADSFAGRPAATAITWTLCVEHAGRLTPKLPVQPMLILAATLDGHSIPGTVFTTSAARNFAGGAAGGLTTPDDAWSCITSLARASLLDVEPDSTAGGGPGTPVVRMHPALQAAVRSASSRENLERTALAAADALLEAWPANDTGSWLADSLRSCTASIMRLAGDRLWTGNGYRILFRTGQSLEDARLTMLAAAHWNHVVAAADRFLGAEHPDAIAASDQLAASFLAAGRGLEALPWFRRVLSNRLSMLGPAHPGTTGFEVQMGRALLAADGAEEAIALFERIAADKAKLVGAADPDTLDARDALADAYCAGGRVREGIKLYQRNLADREKAQGKSHRATLATCHKLADALLAADQVKESLAAYKRVAAGRERTLGADHPDTIAARSKLAAAYQSAGRMAISVQLHEQARVDSERVLGVDHIDTLTRRVHLAHAYYAVGRIGDAASLLRDTADRCDRVLSPGDPLAQAVRESLNNIAGG
ncbi:MAG: tetratricopeptide repeat protein [Streptosporangiaceae bacterium]